MIMNRVFARASHETFSIPQIRELLKRYKVGSGWVDPFARNSKMAEVTNDLDPKTSAKFHMEAEEFIKSLSGTYKGFLFDPPYSYRQITEHYKDIGVKASYKDTSYNFYRRAMVQIPSKLPVGGYVISFGWNTNGVGKTLGFEIVEILVIAHGLHHNDTLVTVERKK